MADFGDLRLMQGLAQRITATHPELVNSDASFGELAWNWGRTGGDGERRLWFADGELVAWGRAELPRRVRRDDGSVKDITGAYLAYQVDPGHAELVDDVIGWCEKTAAGVERTVLPAAADAHGLRRWAAHGYEPDAPDAWSQLNERELTDVEQPALPAGFSFRTASEVPPEAVVQAHVDAWTPTSYTVASYFGVRQAPGYRGDLHVLVEAPDGTMACSAILWLDEVNATVEFEPVGTHPAYRRRGLARAMLLHGMHLAAAAGARHATVACMGEPAPARELYYSVGFRAFSRDAPLIKRG
ncbi:GNAT family N-acetyltransferase [Amycolatopsis rifamycinica]|uniref:GCN5 family acetyltransferase n=1 Tax=Amycolatopsis rifamycinica TaxID=287986 RepID=A0A066TRP3_9PSEU|nr:GNAT family N-acetyltransferase [Amycolatopsis rifamycinica]KDN17545.1 GCN5 family acetyltransferase [Amycolatopsis rifamycinica]